MTDTQLVGDALRKVAADFKLGAKLVNLSESTFTESPNNPSLLCELYKKRVITIEYMPALQLSPGAES